MPHLDATVTTTAVVALCAVISPIFTSLINNLYLVKIRRMELKQQERENTVMHVRKIYEDYLQNAGRCISCCSTDSQEAYGEAYFHALLFAPKELRDIMVSANKEIMHQNMDEATAIIEALAPKIHAIIQTM